MSHVVNPYIAGNPVTGTQMFFGREDVFQFMRQALIGQHRDNVIVLYGQQRTGKTSVLYQMRSRLDERYLCIFLDMHGFALEGLGGFLWELVGHILRALRREYQIKLAPPDRATFMVDPRTSFEHEFLQQVRFTIGNQHLLLMMDEVIYLQERVLAGKLESDAFEYMRHLMQHYEWLNFLFSLGSGLEEMEKEYAFLFNTGLYKKISFLDQRATHDLITQPVENYYQFEPAALDRIYRITSGHPYYTQLLCHCLFNHWQHHHMTCIQEHDVDDIIDEALERGSAVLKYSWEELTLAEKAVITAMAAVINNPGMAIDSREMKRAWRRHNAFMQEGESIRAIRSLIALDIIVGQEKYAFTVDLQRLWVQKHRQIAWVKEELSLEHLKPGSLSWTRNTLLTSLLLVALAILIIGGSGSLAYGNYYLPNQRHISATATAQSMGTITTRSNATATAAIATSDARAASHPPYPPGGAKLIMNDPLQDTSRGYGWETDSANCQFPGDGYHIAIEAVPRSSECFGSKTDFSNFVFEARMTILQGDAGGLVFRAAPNNSKYYEFEVNHNGYYGFYESTTVGNYVTGASGQISGFHTGVDQPNLLAVKAEGDTITFYDNYHFITTVTYYDFSEGQIGFEATSNTNPTEVVFTNAKVWKL